MSNARKKTEANHYRTLGIRASATADEIRFAYRTLARRYHPDVNPGTESTEKFRAIAEAYEVLSDQVRRKQYDQEIQHQRLRTTVSEQIRAYQEQFRNTHTGKRPPPKQQYSSTQFQVPPQWSKTPWPKTQWPKISPSLNISQIINKAKKYLPQRKPNTLQVSVSVIEVSVSVKEAIFGKRKTVQLSSEEGTRKVLVVIPPGVRTGSVVRLKSKGEKQEELVIIVRVIPHPVVSISPKGVVIETPITVSEAVNGASIGVPTFEDDIILKIPPGTQSGDELRVPDRGGPARDGGRRDLIFRVMIKVPDAPDAVGLREKSIGIDPYYDEPVRKKLNGILKGS